jgi:hypothetical protein
MKGIVEKSTNKGKVVKHLYQKPYTKSSPKPFPTPKWFIKPTSENPYPTLEDTNRH